MLCRNEVLLAVLLGAAHHVVADLQTLCQYVFCDFMAIERRMVADKAFGTLSSAALPTRGGAYSTRRSWPWWMTST